MRETALALATLCLLAAWTPFPTAVGPEVPLDAPPLVPVSTVRPALATNGHGALMVSMEGRVSRIGGDPYYFHWASALDENGVPIGPSQSLGWMYSASAASGGSGYLITFIQDGDARAIRFSDTGTRLDTTPIPLLDDVDTLSEVQWDGAAYVVIADEKAISIAEDGRILGTRDVLPMTGTIETASRNGVTLLVNHADAFRVNGPLYAAALGGALQPLGSAIAADVAAGDPGFLVVYESSSGSIFARALDPAGAPAGPERFLSTRGRAPHVAWDGTEWLVLFETFEPTAPPPDYTIAAIRFLDGPLAPPIAVTHKGLNVAATASDDKVFLAWDRHDRPWAEIQSATFDDGALNVNGAAGVVPSTQSQPLMATVDGATLVAWYDGDTRVRRMDGTSPAQTIADAGQPLAFAASEHEALLVTSTVHDVLLFTRVDRNGTPLSTTRYERHFPFGPVGAAWIGDRWIVVYRDSVYVTSSTLARAIINADGTLRDTPQRFGPIMGVTTNGLTVVPAGSEAFVLWGVDSNRTLTFRVDADGVARQGRNLVPGMLNAASRGTDVLTARIVNGAVEWQRVLLDGTVATARASMPLPAPGMTLQTFFTGENYLLLLTKTESAPNRLDLYGLRVDLSGAPIDPSPARFASAFTALPPFFANATLRDATTIDLAYFRPLDDEDVFAQSSRLVFRTVHDSPRRRVIR